MGQKSKNAICVAILPIFIAIAYLFAEFFVFQINRSPLILIGISALILAALTIIIIKSTKDFTACIFLMITLHAIPAIYIALKYLANINITSSGFAVAVLSINWLVIFVVSVLSEFLQKAKRIANFSIFFKLSSIIFSFLYISIFVYALFFYTNRGLYTVREINIIPFTRTILPYVSGSARASLYTDIINMLANIFLFIPIGFYLGVLSKKIKLKNRLIILIFIPVLVEVLQYVFACGISDIDDVIINSMGGLLGFSLNRLIEKLYRVYQKGNGLTLFKFFKD